MPTKPSIGLAGRVVFSAQLNLARCFLSGNAGDECECEVHACRNACRGPYIPISHNSILDHFPIALFSQRL
ncbi:Uncharacterised protein [uncultured archaeon]|nr:Uncharacterised protein [uncultured archaeon]